MTGGYAEMSGRALRLVREEPDQVLRLQAFRVAHPEVVIGDGGFGVWQARIPEPNGERVISRYTLRELLDKLAELTPQSANDPLAQGRFSGPTRMADPHGPQWP